MAKKAKKAARKKPAKKHAKKAAPKHAVDPLRAFLHACFDGDLATVRKCVEKQGMDVNIANSKDMTPLMAAAWQHDRDEVAAYLLSRGASLAPRQASSGWNALCFAAVNNGERCLRLFLKSGAKLDEDAGDWKALAFAVQYRSKKTVPILLTHGAAPNRKDAAGVTPLIRAVKNSDAEMAGMLLGHGADPNLAGPDGWTPLHYACTKANPGLVERLLAAGARTGNRNAVGQTPGDVLATFVAAAGKTGKAQAEIAELLKKR